MRTRTCARDVCEHSPKKYHTYRQMNKNKKQTDRQKDRQTDRQTDRQKDRQTDRQIDRKIEVQTQTNRETRVKRQNHVMFASLRKSLVHWQTDRLIETDRQTNRQTPNYWMKRDQKLSWQSKITRNIEVGKNYELN